MRNSARLTILAASFCLACGCGDGGSSLDDSGGGLASSSSGSSSGSGGSGGGLGMGAYGGNGAGGDDVCAEVSVTFEQVLPTVVLLIDQSGSMTEPFGNLTRWTAVKQALLDPNDGVVSNLDSKVHFGLTLYTSYGGYGGGTCPVLTEVPPALNNHAAIQALLDGNSPEQDTPTGESLSATAAALAQVQEPGPKVIVLATDGMPDTCADPHSQDQTAESVAAVTAAHGAGIDTYVISVGNGVSDSHLQDLANAGVGEVNAPYYQALDPQALVADFNQIVAGVQDCVFSVDGQIAAELACQGEIYLDGVLLGCNDPNGWKLNSASQIELVGDACEAIQEGSHTLEGSFPCGVVTPLPR